MPSSPSYATFTTQKPTLCMPRFSYWQSGKYAQIKVVINCQILYWNHSLSVVQITKERRRFTSQNLSCIRQHSVFKVSIKYNADKAIVWSFLSLVLSSNPLEMLLHAKRETNQNMKIKHRKLVFPTAPAKTRHLDVLISGFLCSKALKFSAKIANMPTTLQTHYGVSHHNITTLLRNTVVGLKTFQVNFKSLCVSL